MGVGAVVQSALYKPLAENDGVGISKVAKSSERFFKRIAYILVVYTVALMLIYPLVADDFDYVYTMLLILVISVSTFAQYYFGMTYKLILSADQLGFIQFTVNSIALILNTAICIVMMRFGASIHFVKLATSLIFLLQPIALSLVARHRYKIDKKIILIEEPIKQKWNGVAQHISAVVFENTDIAVLTIFSTLENVSVYSVYYLVVHGIKQIILALTNGTQAMFGNMLAKKESESINKFFSFFEWIMHTAVTLAFSMTAVLIVPFVSVYTKGINDVNYNVPVFAGLITLAYAIYCIRVPYNTMVLAAGHYKQTQLSSMIEAGLNITISAIAVFLFGLAGVAAGTLAAMLYRTVYLAVYLSKNIVKRNIKHFIKHMVTDVFSVLVFIGITHLFPDFYAMSSISYVGWIVAAIKVGITFCVLAIPINLVVYGSDVKLLLARVQSRITNKR